MIRDTSAWNFAQAIVRPALALASPNFLAETAARLDEAGVRYAVRNHDTTPVVDWMLSLLALQGISDAAAFAFDAKHGGIQTGDIARGIREPPACSKLAGFHAFERCGYRKGAQTCSAPDLLAHCPLPRHALRKGGLNVAAYGLHLFVRDVCRGDLIGWIEARLAYADTGADHSSRSNMMRDALLEALAQIPNTGLKLWSMILSELLLAADQDRERWVTTGADFVAVDSLVHAFLHRTGILRRFAAEHAYGDRCYRPDGCADIISGLAEKTDARRFNPDFPRVFPRFVQHAIWQFCASDARNICNGNQIDDRSRCKQGTCPSYVICDRVRVSEKSRATPRQHRELT